jgi:hypothetical protein
MTFPSIFDSERVQIPPKHQGNSCQVGDTDTVLPYGNMLGFSILLLFFYRRLTAIQDRDSSSGDREDVIVETEMIWYVMPFDSNYLQLNQYTHLIWTVNQTTQEKRISLDLH